MKASFYLAILCTLSLTACGSLFEDESLTFTATPYTGNNLKTSGYFYKKAIGYDYYSIFFLFNNGVVLSPTTGNTLAEYEEEFLSGKYIEYMRKSKHSWGLFNVSQDTLLMEFLSSYGELHAYPVTETWKILNDSTILSTKRIRSSGEFIEARNDTFHYKAFSPKPDSTNNWLP